jgi:hypothetical protein
MKNGSVFLGVRFGSYVINFYKYNLKFDFVISIFNLTLEHPMTHNIHVNMQCEINSNT